MKLFASLLLGLAWTCYTRFCFVIAALIFTAVTNCHAQPGINEMNQASADISRSFFSAQDAVLMLAAIFGITGATKVYYNWQMGKPRITADIAAWFFAALFLILIGPFLQKMLGIGV
jgi:hypothetical protein